MTTATKPAAAKIVRLRIAFGANVDVEKMEDLVAHLKRTLAEDPTFPAKAVTSLGEEYIVDGQVVRVDDFENPDKPKAPQPKDEDAADEVKRLASSVGRDALAKPQPEPQGDPSEVYNPSAIPLQFEADVDPAVVDYLRAQDPERVVKYRGMSMADDQIMTTLQELEQMK